MSLGEKKILKGVKITVHPIWGEGGGLYVHISLHVKMMGRQIICKVFFNLSQLKT